MPEIRDECFEAKSILLFFRLEKMLERKISNISTRQQALIKLMFFTFTLL